MTIDTFTTNLFGQKITAYRVIRNNEVVRVFSTKEEAENWVSSNG